MKAKIHGESPSAYIDVQMHSLYLDGSELVSVWYVALGTGFHTRLGGKVP